jgi:hypothetical protein
MSSVANMISMLGAQSGAERKKFVDGWQVPDKENPPFA